MAARRGPHWKLIRVEESPVGPIDEAELLAEAIAGVMKHVPLPTRELGIVSDLTTCGIAFYSVLAPRIELDRQLAAQQATLRAGAPPAAPRPATPTPPAAPSPPPPSGGGAGGVEQAEPSAADLMASLPSEPLRAAAEAQLGRSVTAELGDDEDPERPLLAAVRPGEEPVPIDVLAGANASGVPLLEQLAPVPEVNGQPVEPELPI